MPTPWEKARMEPDSMKARILAAARRIFGCYGYHGTTTRIIAREVGIDISTLYYHWGEKADLYEAVHGTCEWQLGRGGPNGAADKQEPEPIKTEEIVLCLRRLLKSVNMWNGSGGRTGYLDFIVQYIH